jgi:hypothetical protein
MKEKLEARRKEIEVEFKKLQEEVRVTQQATQQKLEQLLRLDGEHSGLSKLLDGDKVVDIKK